MVNQSMNFLNTMTKRIRTYSDLRRLETFEERFDYLILGGQVGVETFGFDRWVNQNFYTSTEWRRVRRDVIVRDQGRDLGVEGYEVNGAVVVHHMNPMTPDDIIHDNSDILDPEFLITVSIDTHNAIHFGDATKLRTPYVERSPGDTKLW